jgi:putative ABC transport system permease protein
VVTLLSATHARLLEPLKESAHVATVRRLAGARRMFVTAEFSLALLLLVCAGLTIRTFINLQTLDLGFDGQGVLTVDVSPSVRFQGRANTEFYASLIERLATLPGIAAVGAVYQRPFAYEGVGMDTQVLPEGYPPSDEAAWQSAAMPANREAISPSYFDVMGIAVREGRAFSERDTELSAPVAILSEGAARRLFHGQPALGRRLLNDRGPDGQPRWRTIVGVVADVHYRGLHDVRFDLYVPFRQSRDPAQHLVVRTLRDHCNSSLRFGTRSGKSILLRWLKVSPRWTPLSIE